jgi:peptidoglycan/LPS O-acetylase OafA/YrhL
MGPTGRTTAAAQHLVGLDILRAAAIASVLLAHLPFCVKVGNFLPWEALGIWGVELFFALSGFLITGLLYRLFDEFSFIKLGVYLVRRWMRTIPLYYSAIVLLAGLRWGLGGNPVVDLERYFFFIQTIPTGAHQWFSISWSLSIEEWSYVLFPCAVAGFWFVRSLDGRFVILFCSAIFTLTWYRLSLGDVGVPFDTDIRRALIPRLDALAYGGLLRVVWRNYKERLLAARTQLLALSIAGQAVCLCIYYEYGVKRGMPAASLLTLLPVSLCLLFPYAVAIQKVSWPMRHTWHFVASRSYSLYLFHFSVYGFVGRLMETAAALLTFAVSLALAIAIADIAYRWIEKPIMDRRPAEPRAVSHKSAFASG